MIGGSFLIVFDHYVAPITTIARITASMNDSTGQYGIDRISGLTAAVALNRIQVDPFVEAATTITHAPE
jgi:hypothetical protein